MYYSMKWSVDAGHLNYLARTIPRKACKQAAPSFDEEAVSRAAVIVNQTLPIYWFRTHPTFSVKYVQRMTPSFAKIVSERCPAMGPELIQNIHFRRDLERSHQNIIPSVSMYWARAHWKYSTKVFLETCPDFIQHTHRNVSRDWARIHSN